VQLSKQIKRYFDFLNFSVQDQFIFGRIAYHK
jgi:hypothetical protein